MYTICVYIYIYACVYIHVCIYLVHMCVRIVQNPSFIATRICDFAVITRICHIQNTTNTID